MSPTRFRRFALRPVQDRHRHNGLPSVASSGDRRPPARWFAAAALVALGLGTARTARAQPSPHRSATALVSSNGRSTVVYDTNKSRITAFYEHPYKARSDGSQTRNFAYDCYPGLRVGGPGQAGKWLTDVAPDKVEYEPGTGIIHIARSFSGLGIDEYEFAPIDLSEHALVSLLRVERKSGSAASVDSYMLFNFHLGAGAPDPGSSGETIQWDAKRGAWMEWGPSGAAMGYGSIGSSSHHSASPDNPFSLLGSGADLTDNTGTGGSYDDAAAGLQWSLGSVAQGSVAWSGSFVVLDSGGDVAPHIDAVKKWINGRSAKQVLTDELAAWKSWQKPVPKGLSAAESALYQQSMAVLRMGQVSEPGKSDGQILASLPPGQWNIAWVRDMAYATVALARAGHLAEAKRAIEFQLNADADKYESYVGHPYQISVVRYFGDGVEESDSNQDGPNIEFDGFGLFLWEVYEYVQASKDTTSLKAWWPVISSKVADVLVDLQEPSGLIAPDSSIWEVHWNGKQKHFAFTTIAAARGLCAAADLATQAGDSARAKKYLAAGKLARDAITGQLAAPDGTIAQSLEGLSLGNNFVDAAAIEAASAGLLDPAGRSAKATMASMKQALVPASGHGFFRNQNGGWYDSQEWVFVDLRTAVAMRLMGDLDAAPLLDWVTQQSADNFNLVSELYDAKTADYAGSVPMVGFGAGAYALALQDRASGSKPDPCGGYAVASGSTGGAGGSGGASGNKPAHKSGGCGCRAGSGGASPASWWALLAALGLAGWRRRRIRGKP